MNRPPHITLTDFVDFYLLHGMPRLTKVRGIKFRDPYEPAHDFYKRFREGAVEVHELNLGLAHLQQIATSQTDPKKQKHFPPMFEGYRKFVGRKTLEWWGAPSADWRHGDLTVRINPELGLVLDDAPHLIKLYFKEKTITKSHIEGIGHLMHLVLAEACEPGTVMSILEVRTGKLHRIEDGPSPDFTALIRAEAEAFLKMWNTVESRGQVLERNQPGNRWSETQGPRAATLQNRRLSR